MDAYTVYTTAATVEEAKVLARTVVQERLAACANMLGSIQSVYWWDGKVCEGDEVAILLKTSEIRLEELISRLKQLHSYDIPCITCHLIETGNPAFLQWVEAETTK